MWGSPCGSRSGPGCPPGWNSAAAPARPAGQTFTEFSLKYVKHFTLIARAGRWRVTNWLSAWRMNQSCYKWQNFVVWLENKLKKRHWTVDIWALMVERTFWWFIGLLVCSIKLCPEVLTLVESFSQYTVWLAPAPHTSSTLERLASLAKVLAAISLIRLLFSRITSKLKQRWGIKFKDLIRLWLLKPLKPHFICRH